jgi:hypothetical protein
MDQAQEHSLHAQKLQLHTLNRLLGGLEAQAHILVPALATLAWDLASGLLEPVNSNQKQEIGADRFICPAAAAGPHAARTKQKAAAGGC